jgi:hypothetical protein
VAQVEDRVPRNLRRVRIDNTNASSYAAIVQKMSSEHRAWQASLLASNLVCGGSKFRTLRRMP